MKTVPAVIAAVLIVLAGAGWMIGRSSSAASVTSRGAVGDPSSARDPRIVALEQSPQARAWRQRREFEARARWFLQNASRLGAVERSEQARSLSASLDKYERESGLSAGEALLLRTGLIKATVADEKQQAEQIADLMDRYRSHADQRMDAYTTRHAQDPKFRDYKARERAIVEEVMALREIPNGLTRDEYLRQRLQQAREAAYR